MCEQCYELSVKYYPDFTDEERGELLMGATAYPFAYPDTLEKQLIELREKTDGSLLGALAFADAEMTKAAASVARQQG